MAKIEGEIKDLTSFSKALGGMKIITIIVVSTSLIGWVVIFTVYSTKMEVMSNMVAEARREGFAFDPTSGHILRGSFRALTLNDRKKMHQALVQRFVDCWYDFDGETFKENLKMGVDYSSQEVSNMFLAEYLQGEFDLGYKLRDEKMNWYAYPDSVKMDMENMTGVFYGKQKIVKPYGHKWLSLVAHFKIRELDKVTEKNEYAAVVEKWKVVEQKALEEEIY